MSAPRNHLDQYFTDSRVVEAILPRLEPWLQACPVLEPSFGDGGILRALSRRVDPALLTGVEIDGARVADARAAGVPGNLLHANYLSLDLVSRGYRPMAIVGNPPYLRAQEFVSKALTDVSPAGVVCLLLRLGFLASRRRYGLIAACVPDIAVLAERPSFTADGKTDSSEYAWFIWPASRPGGRNGEVSIIRWKGDADE